MRKVLILLLAVFVAGLVGCGDNPTVPSQEADLQPSASTIPPGVKELLEKHADFDADEFPETPESLSPVPYADDHDYDVYAVVFLWGHLANDVAPSVATTDWSGNLTSNAEVRIGVHGTIDFEKGEDSLLPPTDPALAEWVSQTGADFDGLAFRVHLKRGNVYFAAPALGFKTDPISIRIPFHLLEHYVAYYPVGNGQGLAVLARRIWHGACPAGAMRGRWVRETNVSDRGSFEGAWLNRDGEIVGIYAGRFWMNNDRKGEFEGWVSGGITDQVIAELKGIWWYDDYRLCPICGDDHGWFRGKVRFLENDHVGVIRGHFGDIAGPVDQAALPMVGVWKMHCPYADASSSTTNIP